MGWNQPVENSVSSICEAIERFDGVEFDLRLTSDGGIVLHHDREVKVAKDVRKTLTSKYVENNTLDDLMELGFDDFDDLISKPSFVERIAEQGCVACIELKVPHPSSGKGGGWFGSSSKHMSELLAAVDQRLIDHGIPNQNTVFYSFHSKMWKIGQRAKSSRNVATLRPIVPPYGTRTIQRIRCFPQYLTLPLSRLVRWHRWDKSPMIPCALEYLVPPTNRLTLGTPVSLEGRGLKRLKKLSGGYPIYVWPGKIHLESKMLSAGLTPLTDVADPNLSTLPCGTARWVKPATQPLDEIWFERLSKSEPMNHESIIAEARSNLPHWHEMSDGERSKTLTTWRKRFSWNRSVDDLESNSTTATMPWEAVRIVGHRGCGKTD